MKGSAVFLLICLLMVSCSTNNYRALADKFPRLEGFPQHFRFEAEDLPEPIETNMLAGIVRPVGKIQLKEGTEMLISNNYAGEAPWGDVTGYIFVDGQLSDSVLLASDFSLSYMKSTLREDMALEIEEGHFDPDTGDESVKRSTASLKEMLQD